MAFRVFFTSLLLTPLFALGQQVQIDFRHRPPEMVITNDQYSGPIVDTINILLTSINEKPRWVNVPWPRTIQRARAGLVDIIPRHSMTLDRETFLLPMLLGYEQRSVRYLLGPHIKDISKYQTLKDFNQLHYGLLRGSYYGPHIETIRNRGTTTFTNSVEQLLEMLLTGRIDVMPIQNIVWAENAYDNIKNKYKNKQYQLSVVNDSFISGKYISISKSSSLSLRYHELNCRLFQLRYSGEIDTIYLKFKLQPYFQIFDNNESLKQATSCNIHQKKVLS